MISIIVPIYNCEKYLDKCIKSIRNQTYQNLEIILINDGSTDLSEQICLNHKKEDKRIKYIYKTNSGASNTRNLGLDTATGEYVMFVDADDYIDNDYIEIMKSSLDKNGVNVVVSGFTTVDEKGTIIRRHFFDTPKDVLEFDDYIDVFINSPFFTCVKMLMKKEIIEKKFVTDLKYGEDMLFAYNILSKNKLHYTKNCGYYYVQNLNSTTHKSTIESIDKYMDDNSRLFNIISLDYPNITLVTKNRLYSKMNLGLTRLIYSKEYDYKIIKEYIIKTIKRFDFTDVFIENISFGSKLNKKKMRLLTKQHYLMYYILVKITNYDILKQQLCSFKRIKNRLKRRKNEKENSNNYIGG